MSMLTDQQVIDNTHFEVDETERLICYTNLPDGTRYAQAVSSKEGVQKNMIGWCNTVREHVAVKAQQTEDKAVAKKQQRVAPDAPQQESPVLGAEVASSGIDARQLVIDHYHHLQEKIDELGETIQEEKAQRNELRDERDKLAPVMTAWGVTE